MRIKLFLILIIIAVAGCKNEERKPQPATEEKKIDRTTIVPEPKLPPPPPKSETIEEDPAWEQDYVEFGDFSDPEPLERQHTVKKLRAMRQERHLRYLKSLQNVPPAPVARSTRLHMYDEHYQQNGAHPMDVSTYPTNLSRVILETQWLTGVLENEINSQIPGKAVVVIDKAVPSADFSKVLIPSGSKMTCQYESLKRPGSSRLKFLCDRLIRPDGLSVFFANHLAGSDQKGRSGLIGDVDNRGFQRYGSAFLVSLISGMSQIGYNKDQSNNTQQFTHAFGNNLAQITAKLLEESIDLSPSITIASGSLIRFQPAADIYFRKPVAIDEETSK